MRAWLHRIRHVLLMAPMEIVYESSCGGFIQLRCTICGRTKYIEV